MSGESLVVLDTEQAERALSDLRGIAQVTQLLPPRLALVRSGGAALAALPGVVSVHDSAAAELPADLTENERMFVAAWQARSAADGPKTRSGDGLPWDAPGFEPPDSPDGQH